VDCLIRKKFFAIVLGVLLTVSILSSVFLFVILPKIIWQNQINQYIGIMKNLNQTETKSKLRALFDRNYNFTELLVWEHERLTYVEERKIRQDPFEILEYGKGKCEEFSILYVALCLAHGYQARLVFDIYGDHAWAEVKIQGNWTHVDPKEKKIDDPYMYQRDWHKELKLVLAFEDSRFEDVTSKYRRP
jgi:hypothetical protein